MSDSDEPYECKGDECLGCATCLECVDCGIDLSEHDLKAKSKRCRWCRADAEGRPYGGCPDCGGAYDFRRTCACSPTPKARRRS